MTQEHERAIAQAERNAAEAAYFDSDEHKYGPRPNQRPTFRAGFNAGWDRRDAVGVNRVEEIARLTVALEAAQNALKEAIQDCREAYDKGRADQAVDDLPGELQIAAIRQDAQRLSGENAVLRDLLRDCLPVLETVSDDDGEDWMIAMSLTAHIKAALYGQDGDLFSDGAIYAEASRRANPEAHDAALANLLAVIHRDGGMYLAEHGVEKACGDAEAEVAKWISMESGIDAMIEQASRAQREACASLLEDRAEKLCSFSRSLVFAKEVLREAAALIRDMAKQ